MESLLASLVDQIEYTIYFPIHRQIGTSGIQTQVFNQDILVLKTDQPRSVGKLQVPGNRQKSGGIQIKSSGNHPQAIVGFFEGAAISQIQFAGTLCEIQGVFIHEIIEIFQLKPGDQMHFHPGMNKIPDCYGVAMKIQLFITAPERGKMHNGVGVFMSLSPGFLRY